MRRGYCGRTSGSFMTEGIQLEQVRLYLPQYLSPARQQELWSELRAFPNNRSIYSTRNNDPDSLQGDGWRGFVAIDFHTLDRKTVSGLVLSNSCDLSLANKRTITPNITFVPVVKLERYLAVLQAKGQNDEQRANVATTIRRQEIASLMHLPAIHGQMEESLAIFGDVRSQPLDHFAASNRSLLFRLSDFGFYLFLFKLSIHFTRMLEEIER
jgi:hypothetical protein